MLDVNVLIAALLARDGAPARLLLRWLAGDFELIISDKVLSELRSAFSYARLRSRVAEMDASAFADLLESTATKAPDPDRPGRWSRDAGDDYLVALAVSASAVVVTGDLDLLDIGGDFPIYSPFEFLTTPDKSMS